MIHKNVGNSLLLLAVSVGLSSLLAQVAKPNLSAKPSRGYYLTSQALAIASIIPSAPEQESATTKNELFELHRIQTERTPKQVEAAQADDAEEDIFVFRNVMGKEFREDQLPLTAALSMHVQGDESFISRPLKTLFRRPRPYQWDKSMNAVCKLSEVPNAYPSGHAISGYLEAFTLIAMFPEKSKVIMARADEYAHNRLVCGVHYPSDLAASRLVASAAFGYMLANPKFEADLTAARTEIRSQLGMTE
jgi:acid phosphatase (class A)